MASLNHTQILIYILLSLILQFVDCIPKVLLVSFDGLRYDLVTKDRTPNLWNIAESGVRFEHGIQPMYDTMTAPNHYSMLTGLYEQNHGIVGNWFFDSEKKEWFDYFNMTKDKTAERFADSRNSKWYGGTPIWLLNQEQNSWRASGNMYFPTGESRIKNKTISKSASLVDQTQTYDEIAYNYTMWRHCFDEMVQWFIHETKPINFGMFYVGQPDETMHKKGIDHNEKLSSILKELDDLAGYMMNKLKEHDLWDNMNIIWTADHGHSEYKMPKNVIPIYDYFGVENPAKYIIFSGGHSIFAADSSVNISKVYDSLSSAISSNKIAMKVWKKSEFPSEFGFSDSPRVGDIILIPNVGYNFAWKKQSDLDFEPDSYHSTHGYLPTEQSMHASLILTGPSFFPGRVEPSRPQIIDLYPLMCHLLDIDVIPANNGSLKNLGKIFSRKISLDAALDLLPHLSSVQAIVTFCIIIPAIMFLCFVLVCVFYNPRKVANNSNNGQYDGYMKLLERDNHNSRGINGSLLNKGSVESLSEDEI